MLTWEKFGYLLLVIFLALNYGLLLTAFIRKIAARVGRRRGIPFYQNYIDLFKLLSLRKHITHGVMFYLGPVFRLGGGVGLLMFVPVLFNNPHFSNLSFEGDLVLILYFMFFGTLGMALGAGEGGHPNSAIAIARGLSQTSAYEVPLILGLLAVSAQYQTLSISKMVAAQQGGIMHWTLFTNPLASIAILLALLGSFMHSPFDVVITPQETPIGPPTEYHSAFLATLSTNRSIFPVAKLVLFTNILMGGSTNWFELILKTFILFLWPVFVGVVFPRFRTEQSVRWFLKYPAIIGILAIIVISI